MESYNLEKLIKIKTHDFKEIYWLSYKTKINFLGFTLRPEGIHSKYGGFWGTTSDCIYTVIDGIVYEKPNVVLEFQNNITKIIHFNTIKEMKEYTNYLDNKKSGYWLNF